MRIATTISAFFLLAPFAFAGFDESAFVYIECYSESGERVSRGSGVIIHEDGRLLTAKHVVPSDTTCKGVLGTGAETPTRNLIRGRPSHYYDAMIMRFVPRQGETFNPIQYVRLQQDDRGESITAHGVPFDGVGQISRRTGTISTTVPNENGMIETNILTARGISGGPVILDANRSLVGIVGGVSLDPISALPTNYGVLLVEVIANELEIEEYAPNESATLEDESRSQAGAYEEIGSTSEFLQPKVGWSPYTSVLLVRHEKKTTSFALEDPGLSEEGRTRTDFIDQFLRGRPLSAVYATEYRRTRETATPIAQTHSVPLTIRPAVDIAGLVDEILSTHAGQTVLVVGHANTVPKIISELGVDTDLTIEPDQYGPMYVVLVSLDGKNASLLEVPYGSEDSDNGR